MRWALLAALAPAACGGGETGTTAPLEGPVLSYAPPEGPWVEGVDFPVEVQASDPDGVAEVLLFVRTGGFWVSLPMVPGDGDAWTATIPGDDVRAPELAFTFRATDGGDPGAVSELPVAGQDDPFTVEVIAPGEALPFSEDFEDALSGYDPLFSLGWTSVALGFGGSPWAVSVAESASGEASVAHLRGLDGSEAMDDWLLSPALDLSSEARIQVRWNELGRNVDGADHSLWISTGSRDPRDGDYEQVAVLEPPPEGAWGRSPLIDLTPWAGAPSATLAWRYVGAEADDWYLDDIEVRRLGCDLELSGEVAPAELAPGDLVTFTWTLTNRMDVDCDPLTASLEVPDGAGELQAVQDDPGVLAAGASTTWQAELLLDPEWPDDSYLPVTLTVTDGQETWSDTLRPVVGDPSTGTLRLEVDDPGLLVVSVGVGDPSSPAWEDELLAEVVDAGPVDLTFDLTDRSAWLPPQGGDGRWFARIDPDVPGRAVAFAIDQGEDHWESAVLPAWEAGEEVLLYLPDPADPLLVDFSTTPDPVAPGDQVRVAVTLRNGGEPTAGPVTASVVSLDPDLAVLTPGPLQVTTEPWGRDEEVTLSGIRLGVSPDHVDSSPLAFRLDLDDGQDVYEVPLTLEVPWPVPRVLTLQVDDGADGLLDPGEAATLAIELVNAGDLPTDGLLDGILAVDPGSEVAATLLDDSDLLGTLDPDETGTMTFDLQVDAAAAAGQVLALVLELSDDSHAWALPVTLVLGEAPWVALSAVDDPTGDANGFTFDLVNGWYRLEGGQLQLLLEAAEPPDPKATFVEMWAVASGGSYTYYRLVFQSGTGWLQGYDSAFVSLGDVSASWPDDRHLLLAWDASWMDPAVISLQVGFGAGWCAAETGSYCDHFPDDWGYYYTGYDTVDFFTMAW